MGRGLGLMALALILVSATGCNSCLGRPGTGLRVSIPADVLGVAEAFGVNALTLKVRVRALGTELPDPEILNDLPEASILLDERCPDPVADPDCISGRDAYDLLLDPPADGPWRDIPATIHLALFMEDVTEVADAFAAIDDPILLGMSCAGIPCSHDLLSGLRAIAAYTLTVDAFGRDDANVVMYPLLYPDGAGGYIDIDPDGDTMPGSAAMNGDTCVDFLIDTAAPWSSQSTPACEAIQDPGHMDCDDLTISVNPLELEPRDVNLALCVDGLDQDCRDGDGPCDDLDGDGFSPPADCNDSDPNVFPGAAETTCDAIDQDCDGMDSVIDCDGDDDGYCPGAMGCASAGLGGGDCDDADANVNPVATEVCENGIDENCDMVDPDCANPDADGDGFCAAEYDCGPYDADGDGSADDCDGDGMPDDNVCRCPPTPGRPVCCLVQDSIDPMDLASCGGMFTDCADWDPGINDAMTEVCTNGYDDNCDGMVDGADGDCDPADADGDGFVAPADCDDTNPAIHPDAGEICDNGIDDDCAGGDATCSAATDSDGDTYVACTGGATSGCDCDDTDPAVNPGATETCNTVDDDCNGIVNDGNPGGGGPESPTECYGNNSEPMYMGGSGEAWRCRVGATVCTPAGALECILYSGPSMTGAMDCDVDSICNGRNDVCVPCVADPPTSGPDVAPAERDVDGDGCFAGCNTSYTLDGVLAVVGDTCDGTDCCDDGTESTITGCSTMEAANINTARPELCADQGVDNDCDGNGNQICGSIALGDACSTGLMGVCGAGAYDCSGSLSCSVATGDMDDGMACNTYCNPTACPYDVSELCNTVGTDNDCDGDAMDVDEETSAGVYNWQEGASCTNPSCMTCVTDTWQCTGNPMPTCAPPSPAPAESCDGMDTDCDCQTDFDDPDAQADCGGGGLFCDGTSCVPGCTSNMDCTNGNTCNLSTNQCTCSGASPCTGNTMCDTGTGNCFCGNPASVCGPMEVCNPMGDCTCGVVTASTGEACADPAAPDCDGANCTCNFWSGPCQANEVCSPTVGCECGSLGMSCTTPEAPDCNGAGCFCAPEGSACDMFETCGPTGCECGFVGTSCDTIEAPDCDGSMCTCNWWGTPCDANEACDPMWGCECGSLGMTCSTPEAPDCNGTACYCGTEGSACDPFETCGPTGCECGFVGTSCDTIEAPDCDGNMCTCMWWGTPCDANEACDPSFGCECGSLGMTCSTAEAPDCNGSACFCATEGAACDPLEMCGPSGCECGFVGTSCDTPEAPDCDGGMCTCMWWGSPCPSGESCDINWGCECGSMMMSCQFNPENPTCIGGVCACDGNSTCGIGEWCNTTTGSCECGTTSSSSGPACSGTHPNCSGVECWCESFPDSCSNGFLCFGDYCGCTGDAQCNGGTCVGGQCQCSGPLCNWGETCTGPGGSCTCTGGSCP